MITWMPTSLIEPSEASQNPWKIAARSRQRKSTICSHKLPDYERPMRREQYDHLAASIVEFSRFLKMNGLPIDLRRTITALEAAKTVNVADEQSFVCALQTALCSTIEEWKMFPELFHQFWSEPLPRPRSASGEYKGPSRNTRHTRD